MNLFLIKTFNYNAEAKVDFDLNDNNCIIQDKELVAEKEYTYNNNDVQLVLFTTGTESNPRAVELTFDNIFQSTEMWSEIISFKKGDKYLNIMPLHHVAGVSIFFRSIYCEFISIIKTYDKKSIIRDIQINDVNCISVVPKMLDDIIDLPGCAEVLKKMKLILIGGDAISYSLYQYMHTNKINGYCSYGMTETSSGIAGYWIKDKKNFELGYLGAAHRNVRLKLKDKKIAISSKSIMKKYVHGVENNNFYKTNDYGELINNNIYFISRGNDVVVSGGENINLNNIKNILIRYPEKYKNIVVGYHDKKWGTLIVVIIEGDIDRTKIDDLRLYCINELPKYMVPKHFICMDSIPCFDNYKIDYKSINLFLKEKLSGADSR